MFQDENLKKYLEESFTVKAEPAVIAEWNMNIPGNIEKIGNYRYRENSTQYSVLPNLFDLSDNGNFYTGATDADTTIRDGLKEDGSTPQVFTYIKDKEKLLYSLEDCLKPFRPRSGINKLSYFTGKYLPSPGVNMYLRPRYYMPNKDDEFKYWRSYRTESDTKILYPYIISTNAIVSDVSGSSGNWTATISGLNSVSNLNIGKVFAASTKTAITISSTATVSNITGSGPWTATLTGLTSTSGVVIGDRIAATDDTGKLFGGSPTSVVVSSIVSNSSITYTVTGGTAPIEGTVDDLETVPGNIGTGVATVTEILGPFSIRASINSTQTVSYGSIRNVYVNDYRLNEEFGISENNTSGRYAISDTNPFVVYKEPVPANRIVIKVQTNVGEIDEGPFGGSAFSSIDDPFFGEQNKTVPKVFKIQYLDASGQWLTAYEFDDATLRRDQTSPVFGADGHLSIEYGLEIPFDYLNNFVLVDTVKAEEVLPSENIIGNAYIVAENESARGTLYVFNGVDYDTFVPNYTWFIGEDETYSNTHFVTNFVEPLYYNEGGEGENIYREFVWIRGIRLAVETMNTPDTPLELIEMSPRLAANMYKNLLSYDVTKAASDLAGSALPVGQIMAGVGSIVLFDTNNSFNINNEWDFQTNSGSIIAKYLNKNIKFSFYEVIKNVEGINYYIPIKTMYSEGFPAQEARSAETTLTLRDFYFYFESLKAPRLLLNDVSLSQAICLLLDSVGFSNYIFKRKDGVPDPVIPNFFIQPEQSIAETLAFLAKGTQSAMFFDEYNNFVVMTKEYLLDESIERIPDATLYGSTKDSKLPNIIAVASQEKKVFNAGTITFTSRDIKRTAGTIAQRKYVDRNYIYNPSLLWEVGASEKTTSANAGDQTGYILSAMPLNTNLDDNIPVVTPDNILINNTLDVGENAYLISRFKGFLYANGEIIKYDAVEFNVTGIGNVWISDNLEYQKYFSQISFNGKMYPTGLIRIYAEPFYETFSGIGISRGGQIIEESVQLKPGPVVAHGRGQFGTPIINHKAGLDPYWSNNANVQGCKMDSDVLFNTEIEPTVPPTDQGQAGLDTVTAFKSQRNGIIRNFLSSKFSTETDVTSLKTPTSATIQSSALVMTGPDFEVASNARDHVSYVHKLLDKSYKHFGTRLRIIGKVEASADRSQTVVGGMTYYNINGEDPTQSVSIGGGSAGVAIVNPNSNNGYYFEIAALTSDKIESLLKKDQDGNATVSIENILFYKVKKASGESTDAIPVKLWGGIGNIIVDDGNFVGQNRVTGEANPTVYDLAIEYVDINNKRRDFYLYINQKLVARITDNDPLPLVNKSIALFVRGSSKAMFENIYALGKNYADNTVFETNAPIARIFGDDNNQVNASEALTKYAMSGVVQNTYLTSISPSSIPGYSLYYEEFGTIMREAAYFNIKYDKAYPALYAKIAPTFNRVKGYTVSGFTADSYGAEFLVFNNTDSLLRLDSSTGNPLRIQGIAFTGDVTTTITVDDYLKKRGSLSDPELVGSTVVSSPFKFTEQYEKVRQSRILYGKNDFTLDSMYIQDQEAAENILGWVIEKNIRPRKSVGLSIFSMPTLQLGDIVNIHYKNEDEIDLITPESTKFIVYNISYSRSVDGPEMTVYLSEV